MSSLPAQPVYLDNSMRRSLHTCTLQCWLRYVMHRSTQTTNADLFGGTCGHEGVAEFYRTGSRIHALEKFDALYKEWSIANVAPTDGKSWQTMCEVLNVWAWRREMNPPYQPVRGCVEVFASAPLDDTGLYVYTGMLDALVAVDNGYAIEETKFTRSIQKFDGGNSRWLENFLYDTQITGYLYLAPRAWPSLRLNQLYINGLECRRPVGVGTKSKKCPTHKRPYEECRAEHITTVVQGYIRQPEEIAQWQYWALQDAKRLAQLAIDYPDLGAASRLPTEGKHMPFAACERCEFKRFCLGPLEAAVLEAGTEEVVWGPSVGKPAR